MNPAVIVLLFVFQIKGIRGVVVLYSKPGDEAVLPCESLAPISTCSSVYWLHDKLSSTFSTDVINGKVNVNSGRAERLRVDASCSLIISNITEEDSGRYTCRPFNRVDLDSVVPLNVLTVKSEDDDVTLTCSLLRYHQPASCKQENLHWLDDEGTELEDDDEGFTIAQRGCVSYLTIKRQSDQRRKFSCQYVEGNDVKIEVHYQPDPPAENEQSVVVATTVVVTLLLLFIMAAFLFGCKQRTKRSAEQNRETDVQTPADADEENLTYTTVDHSHPNICSQKKEAEAEVTYSAVRTDVDSRCF